MKSELISIIINVYNGEKFIKKCLECAVGQTYKNLEILVVDDGSTDGTLKICKTFKDKRIRIISTKNKGLALSRNVGIDNAKGEYLYFVDADDFIELDTIEYLYGLCKKYKTKMATCGVLEIYDYNFEAKPKKEKDEVATAKEMLKKNVLSEDYAINLWNKLMKKEIFDGIRFEDRPINDLAVTYKLIIVAGRIIVGNQIKYYYLRNKDSITVKKKNDYERSVDIFEVSMDRFNDIKKIYPEFFYNEIGMMKNIVLLYTRRNKRLHQYLDERGARKIFKKMFKMKLVKYDLKKRYKIIIVLFRVSPKLYECLLRLYLFPKRFWRKKYSF